MDAPLSQSNNTPPVDPQNDTVIDNTQVPSESLPSKPETVSTEGGSETFPTSSETYTPEVVQPVETITSIEVGEKVPIPTPKPEVQTQEPNTPVQTTPPPQEELNVVDKTEEVVTLHDVKTKDKLTNKADDEEEEFIRNVEAAHDGK